MRNILLYRNFGDSRTTYEFANRRMQIGILPIIALRESDHVAVGDERLVCHHCTSVIGLDVKVFADDQLIRTTTLFDKRIEGTWRYMLKSCEKTEIRTPRR